LTGVLLDPKRAKGKKKPRKMLGGRTCGEGTEKKGTSREAFSRTETEKRKNIGEDDPIIEGRFQDDLLSKTPREKKSNVLKTDDRGQDFSLPM